ncbi:MAG: bifunctional UDP-N-acetylglucosamine diphosphorylase/glucosamine-1-phosphate N-acetyltransferase GlmU [Aestuariivita sp.]|nr:bifunctional UDP-N-acetylglucosamine diphosphorylase/glucosamine-1-phosphate N-acetyltransferase GlmU [Aestuariivita sp.]
MSIAFVILAAGKGTRMQSDLPKALHQLGGASLLHHTIRSGQDLNPNRTIVVASNQDSEQIKQEANKINTAIEVITQEHQYGTAHAVSVTKAALADFKGNVIILYADTPLITSQSLKAMINSRSKYDIIVLGFEAQEPTGYGRLVMSGTTLDHIVEEKEANDPERAITLCNSGLLACDRKVLFDLINKVNNNNATKEYYLTDIVALAKSSGLSSTAVICNPEETLGINTREELATAESMFQSKKRIEVLKKGVTLIAPETVFFSFDTDIKQDVTIEPNVVFGPGVTIQSGAVIRSFSHLEGANIGSGCVVGPFARIRPDTILEEYAKIGNFVEVKAAQISKDAKINHLSYIGDTAVGEATNIGAGSITCNFDSVMKHRTTIGANAFIGSNTIIVAPVTIGDGAITASGTIVTKDVMPKDLVISRSKITVRHSGAERLRDILKLRAKAKRE